MPENPGNPLLPFLDIQKAVILDGGLATTLEDRGFDLDDDLWSALVLLEDPAAIAGVHRDFLAAGADVIITATYQATISGLARKGLNFDQARDQLEQAVRLATIARDEFWSVPANRSNRLRPLVAASVGPYGAFLADGSEYVGSYGLAPGKLLEFHRDRWNILAAGPSDILACETLPCLEEAAVLLELLGQTPNRWAWFSFSCRDGSELSDGSPFAQAVDLCSESPQVAAIGINCTAPEHLNPLLEIARERTDLPLVVYPNSGEDYDPQAKAWTDNPTTSRLRELAPGWLRRGAGAIGGCCRTGPEAIADLRAGLLP